VKSLTDEVIFMSSHFNPLKVIAVSIFLSALIACGNAIAQSPSNQHNDAVLAALGRGFVSGAAKVNGTTVHYVRGGTGPAVILVHGFPENWSAFRRIMPRLAKKFSVIAVDLRGVGSSKATAGGYDAANMAEDIYQLTQQLKLERSYVVGHDIGGSVAYAFARLHPNSPRGAMILDVPLPGIEPWDDVKADPQLWHMAFHQTPDLPEKLIAGRQLIYFREQFFKAGTLNKSAISHADAARYANAYAKPQQLRAGMEFYRAFPANEKFNSARVETNKIPIVLAGGDHSFGKLLPRVAEGLRKHGCATVTIEVIENCGHYVMDEQPEAVAELIERYAAVIEAMPSAAASQPRDNTPAGFVGVSSDEIQWMPNPAVPGARLAVLFGEPSKAGPYAFRVRLPANAKVMPHTHPEARTYTVLAGEWKLGFGKEYDARALRTYRVGDVFRLPARVPHFQAVGPAEAIVQIEGIGPTATDYVDEGQGSDAKDQK
jgi:pimeloyl-ACP methyl ester carboxylesterase/quercetin dioxygenase-like cupin family protein